MSSANYTLGSAYGANVEKDGDQWTLVLVRELKHAPSKVWSALTDPEQLKHWAPFDTDKNLGSAGTHANLTTIGAPQTHVTETIVKRAEAPRVLEYSWGGRDVRWELEPNGSGTRLTLWAGIDKNWIAMGAAGWHLCIDVLDHMLAGDPIGRTVGMDAMKVEGWQRLLGEYSKQFKAS